MALNSLLSGASQKLSGQANIFFVGGGNMGRSLIGGLITNGYSDKLISVVEPNADSQQKIAKLYNVDLYNAPDESLNKADVIVIATKPQILKDVALSVKEFIKDDALIISIAAGVRLLNLAQWLGSGKAIIRVMPNTPALVQEGMSVLVANSHCSEEQQGIASGIMDAVGKTLWLDDEKHMDTVTAVSGSGPAYFFLIMEAMQTTARKMGLTAEQSKILTQQTALGAATMALQSQDDVTDLRKQVTSPGGTTEQALNVLLEGDIHDLFRDALKAASNRSKEMAKDLGDD